jgi:hypothetical protein
MFNLSKWWGKEVSLQPSDFIFEFDVSGNKHR